MVKRLKTAVVSGVTFQAESVSAAKAKGEATIGRFVKESLLGPAYIRVHDMAVLVWADLEGWNYRVLDGTVHSCDGGVRANLHPNCMFHAPNRIAACLEGVYAAAQRQWTSAVTDDRAWYEAAYGVLQFQPEAASKISDLVRSAEWQRRYEAAISAGADKHTAWDNAGRTASIEACVALCRKELGLV